MEGGEIGEVLHGGELVVEHGGVAHVGHTAALAVRCAGEDGDGAAGGCDEAGDDAEEGGFAGAVFSEDDGGAAGGEGGGDVAQGGEGAVDPGDRVERCGGRCFGAGWGCSGHLLVALLCLHASIGLTPRCWQRVGFRGELIL